MPFVQLGELRLAYELMGEGEPVLLIMGLGTQLVHWPEDFCRALVDRGFQVIRFDNRDAGLSSRVRAEPEPGFRELWRQFWNPDPASVPYTLSDMARDAVGLLDHLGIERAHVLGVSLGGMVAQTLAIEHPERVATLTSVSACTGRRRHLLGRPRALAVLFCRRPRNPDEAGRSEIQVYRAIGSPPGRRPGDEQLRLLGVRAFVRSPEPPGALRQLAALLASGERDEALRRLSVPTLVVHGTADPLLPLAGGEATARAVPGARSLWLRGLGHDLPFSARDEIVQAFTDLARQHPVAGA